MFAQVSREIVVQCYRANELPRSKKAKKTQKDVDRKTAGITPQVYDMESVYTDPVEPFENTTGPKKLYQTSISKKKKRVIFNICECNDSEPDQKYKPKTWDSLTKYYGKADTTEVWANPENRTTKFKEREYKRKYIIGETNGNPKDNFYKKQKRKSKIHKKRGHYLKSQNAIENIDPQSYANSRNDVPVETPVVSLFRNENTKQQLTQPTDDNTKFKKKSRSKESRPEDLSVIAPFKKKCPDGVCAEEAMKNKSYICKCNIKKAPPLIMKECTDASCKISRNSLSINSVVKIKDKFLCICHKYSQKIINMKPHKDEGNRDQILTKNKQRKQVKKNNDIYVKKEHESEQTGEPFFEIQVNPRDMCVLNPIEIKENVIKYGRPEKNEPKCICPSRGRLKSGEVCKAGACKKAYKNKQMNFNCWCDKKIAECGDGTCDFIKMGSKRRKQKSGKLTKVQKLNKPLLEVQLDMDKMCVVNPKEIEDKIMNNISVDDVCSSGICRDAALDLKIPFVCKCIRKKINSEITECTGHTCMDATKKKKSKLSLLYEHIRSKSENWSHRRRNNSQKRIKRRSFYEFRPKNVHREKITTQPDTLQRGKLEIIQEKRPKLNVTQKDVKIYNNKTKLNEHNIVIPRPKPLQLNLYKPTNTKHTEIPKELKYKTNDIICACAHTCQCDLDKLDDAKIEMKNMRYKEKQQRKKLAQKKRSKRIDDRTFVKDMKQRAKLDKKGEKRAEKERMREIRMMQKKMKEEPLDTNFCTAFLLGILKIGVRTIIFIFTIICSVIRKPRKAYWYIRDRISDPEGTYIKLKKWFRDAIMIKKLQVSETIRGSDTLTILADHFLDTPLYQSLANKGRTKNEQSAFEQKSKARKRRIRKREQQAIHSCRHMLLTTLRQTPCLWVYHICPDFYPQCLSFLAFMRSFSRILLFLVAFACWTPCILSFELCRAFLCCFMCTG